ncbi:MAG: NYN domain-containing protein [Gaiellaceae bacterium]
MPTPQHIEIANLPGVKLRLGRLTAGGQKGVDSRIVRDLIMLATHRAISTAYLLGGDEDLREGVSEAQERGVKVTLIGVEPLDEQNLSPTLAMEADEVLVLDRDFVSPHIRERAPDVVPTLEPADPRDPEALGRAFAAAHMEREGPGVRQVLLDRRPRTIPPDVDRLLLVYASRSLGVGRVDDDVRREIRRGFWTGVEEHGE